MCICIQSSASCLFTKYTWFLKTLPGAFALVLGFLASTYNALEFKKSRIIQSAKQKARSGNKVERKRILFNQGPLVVCAQSFPEGLLDAPHYLERPKVTFLVFKAIQITVDYGRHIPLVSK